MATFCVKTYSGDGGILAFDDDASLIIREAVTWKIGEGCI
jgi:hypothetical protein